MFIFKYKLSLLSLLLILFTTNVSSSIDLQIITDSSLDSTVGDGTNSNWLLLFYLESCPHCANAKDVLKKLSQRPEIDSEDFPVRNLQIGKIECSVNNWACMRFNVTRVPYIVMLQNNRLFEYNHYVADQKLLNFITEDKLIEKGEIIPPVLGWSGIFFKIFEETANTLNESIQNFIVDTLGLDIKWNAYFTIILLFNALALILLIEYFIVFYLCGKKKVKKTQVKVIEEEKKEEKVISSEIHEEKKEETWELIDSNKEKKD